MTTTPTLDEEWATLDRFRSSPRPQSYPANVRHLFSPIDRVHEALVALCSAAKVSLSAAMYGWDDDEIDALFREKLDNEYVTVTLCLDKSQAGGVHERAILAKWKPGQIGNTVVIGQSSKHAISHDKMIVIDGLVTICGSTNLSGSGETKQNNEAVIVFDPVFAVEATARIERIRGEMATQMAAAQASPAAA